MPRVMTFQVNDPSGIHKFKVTARGLAYLRDDADEGIVIVPVGELREFLAWLLEEADEKFPPSSVDP